MVTKPKSGMLKFSLKPAWAAKKVVLAGTFSNWQPVQMTKQKDGSYSAQVAAPPGSHQYRFIVDDNWIEDPDNKVRVPNPFGGANSVAQR